MIDGTGGSNLAHPAGAGPRTPGDADIMVFARQLR